MDESSSTREDKIRKRAFAIWELEGQPEGQSHRHWRQAEAEIEGASEGVANLPNTRRRRRETASATPPDPAGDQQEDPVPLAAPSDSEGG